MEAIRTLPASWFTSQSILDIEKRAVFDGSWYLIGPGVRFEKEPEVDYEFAGVAICVRYHGQDNFEIFRRSDAYRLNHYLTPTGVLFTTISDSAPTFEEFFPSSLLPLLNKHDFRALPHRRSLKYPGRFNWKTMVDGYQECLHCQYTHREFSQWYPPTFYAVQNEGPVSRHFANPSKPDDGLFLFFFPICTLNRYGGGMTSFRVCPGEKVGDTRMEFDYYYRNHTAVEKLLATNPVATQDEIAEAEMEGFDEYFKFVRRVAIEDFDLCEVAQSNLERGVYCQGVLNRGKENGVLHYQQRVRRLVAERFEQERQAEQEFSVKRSEEDQTSKVEVEAY